MHKQGNLRVAMVAALASFAGFANINCSSDVIVDLDGEDAAVDAGTATVAVDATVIVLDSGTATTAHDGGQNPDATTVADTGTATTSPDGGNGTICRNRCVSGSLVVYTRPDGSANGCVPIAIESCPMGEMCIDGACQAPADGGLAGRAECEARSQRCTMGGIARGWVWDGVASSCDELEMNCPLNQLLCQLEMNRARCVAPDAGVPADSGITPTPDAGVTPTPDAGQTTTDAGIGRTCTSSVECNDGNGCTQDTCDFGTCLSTPDPWAPPFCTPCRTQADCRNTPKVCVPGSERNGRRMPAMEIEQVVCDTNLQFCIPDIVSCSTMSCTTTGPVGCARCQVSGECANTSATCLPDFGECYAPSPNGCTRFAFRAARGTTMNGYGAGSGPFLGNRSASGVTTPDLAPENWCSMTTTSTTPTAMCLTGFATSRFAQRAGPPVHQACWHDKGP